MNKINVKIGDKYNKLTIIEDIGYHVTSGGNKLRLMKCECECGNKVEVTLNQLRSNKTVSCGCFNLEKAGKHFIKHNLSNTRIYRIWKDMLRRCNNPNRRNYKDYGGRGIEVCKEWSDDFMNFYSWSIDNGYNDGLTIERVNVNRNYEPDNCEWITSFQQKSNTRKQKEFLAISPDGKEYTVKVQTHFAVEHGLDRRQIGDCLRGRQKTHKGWRFTYIE